MKKLFAVLLLFPALIAAQEIKPSINGEFKVVTIRNASDVAALRMPEDMGGEAIGQTITFMDDGIFMEGMACDKWEVNYPEAPVINLEDPILADIHVGATDSPQSSGDQRIGISYSFICEGEAFMNVYQVDNWVLVIPWGNSSQYLIAERELSKDQIIAMQAQLRNYKFLEGELTGFIDNKTMGAISAWSHYRLANDDGYVFKRAAITENLLDTFGIPDN